MLNEFFSYLISCKCFTGKALNDLGESLNVLDNLQKINLDFSNYSG